MSFRKYGIQGETLHAHQNMSNPSEELRAAFQINSSSFYTRELSHATAGVIHIVLENKKEDE